MKTNNLNRIAESKRKLTALILEDIIKYRESNPRIAEAIAIFD